VQARGTERFDAPTLRLLGRVVADHEPEHAAAWPVRNVPITSLVTCASVTGRDASSLRSSLARPEAGAVVRSDGVTNAYFRPTGSSASARTVNPVTVHLVAVRVVLPTEPACPALRR
jgi:hypothetical protein